MQCPICSNSKNNYRFRAKEMMIGTREEFNYIECNECDCVWLEDIPKNMADYYPRNYYSYARKKWGLLEGFQKKHIALSRLGIGSSWLGKLFTPFYPRYLKWLDSHCSINLDSRILDVGSGTGRLLHELKSFGFASLTGIDPFIEKDILFKNGIEIYKKSILEVNEQFDFVMLHHSFEHMEEPFEVLRKLKTIVGSKGKMLIRIPVSDSYGYRHYGKDWVELDPPRHFFIHSKKSMHLMLTELGMKIDHIMFDSSNFEIMESEKWKMDIPSVSKDKYFSRKEKSDMNMYVDQLNEKGEGSRACFYISSL